MTTKTILTGFGLILITLLFSFKNHTGDNTSRTVLISVLQGRGEHDGFVITYGDGTKETRPYKTKIKPIDRETWIQAQLQATGILNEFKEKGYRFAGSHVILSEGLTVMILEKE